MEKSCEEQVERWAKFVINNPEKWKKEHTNFIDAQFDKSQKFYKKILNMPDGLEIIKKLRQARTS